MTRTDSRSARSTLAETAVCSVLLFAALLGLRFSVIVKDVLWWDDFAVPMRTSLTYLGSYRPVMYLEYHFWEMLIAGHFWMGLPKYLGLCYSLAALLLLTRFLRRLGVPPTVSVASSLLIAVHPIATDALFWSSLRAMGLGLIFVLLGVDRLWFRQSTGARVSGFVFLTLGALTYQWLLSVAGILLLAAAAVAYLRGEVLDRARLLWCALALFAAALIMLGWTEATRAILYIYDDRQWATASSPREAFLRRYHGWFDNWVNVFMPPVAAIATYRRAWSLWKWLPLFFTLLALGSAFFAGLRRSRLLVASVLPVGLSAVAAAFTLLLPFSTHAWRTSLAALIGFAVGLAICGSILWEQRVSKALFAFGAAFFLVAAAWATHLDDGRRTAGYFESVQSERAHPGQSVELHGGVDETFGGYALTVGYTPFTRREYTPYVSPWVVSHFRAYVAAHPERPATPPRTRFSGATSPPHTR